MGVRLDCMATTRRKRCVQGQVGMERGMIIVTGRVERTGRGITENVNKTNDAYD